MKECNCTVENAGIDSCVGVVETVDAITQSKTVEPTTEWQSILPDDGYNALNSVIIKPVTHEIDKDILPENIRYGVTILGVTGTYKGDSYELDLFPPRASVGGTQSEDFYPTDFSIFEDGQYTGYQMWLDSDTATAKQEAAIAAQFNVVGVKQYNGIAGAWQWINGSAEASLRQFAKGKSIVIENQGIESIYKIYKNISNYPIGGREVRFYILLDKEV